MKYQFNKSALAKLSKTQLLALKADLKAQFHAASSKREKAIIRTNIKMIEMSLTFL